MTQLRLLSVICFFIVIFIIPRVRGEIEDEVIKKDLYAVLGLEKSPDLTSTKIKQAYRSLAKKYHPDKAKPDEKESSEKVFSQIAEAYEILSSPESRAEYDNRRGTLKKLENREYSRFPYRSYDSSYEEYFDPFVGHGVEFGSPQNIFSMMNDLVEQMEMGHGFQSHHVQLNIIGSSLFANQVVMPLSVIMLSDDQSHFAFLDLECSLRVYQGDMNYFLQHLSDGNIRNLVSRDMEEKFRTRSAMYSNGDCFAGLTEGGVLSIFEGSPTYPTAGERKIWTSSPFSDEPYRDGGMFRRFVLQLTNSGELILQCWSQSHFEPHCVWSSKGCDNFFSIFTEVRETLQSAKFFSQHLKALSHISNSLHNRIRFVFQKLFSIPAIAYIIQLMQEFTEDVGKAVFDVVRSLSDFLALMTSGDNDDWQKRSFPFPRYDNHPNYNGYYDNGYDGDGMYGSEHGRGHRNDWNNAMDPVFEPLESFFETLHQNSERRRQRRGR